MHGLMRQVMIAFLAFALVFVPFAATVLAGQTSQDTLYASGADEGRGSGEMLFDLFAVRPVGILGTAVGFATYLVSLPFSVMGGNPDEVGKRMVEESTEYTFKRPLGQL